MAKRVFAIVLGEPHPRFSDDLEQRFPDSYKVSPTVFLVRPSAPMLVKNVAQVAGLKTSATDQRPTGVVYKLNAAYWGYADRSLWEWLDASTECTSAPSPTKLFRGY